MVSSSTPIVADQFGDEAVVENIVLLLVQREFIHQALQQGHPCTQPFLFFLTK